MLSVTGLGSGLDINSMVDQLVAAERAGSDAKLTRDGTRISSELSALGTFKASVSSFKSSLSGLANLKTYGQFTASSSNEEALSVTASNDATANQYNLNVSSLASSHSLASVAYQDKDEAAIGEGVMTFRMGTTDYNSGSDTYNSFSLNPESAITEIIIDETNNTLEGIMKTINEADFGVRASIVNDGNGYRLLMSSSDTGESNSLEIAVVDNDGNSLNGGANAGLSGFAFNQSATNLIQTNAGQNAEITINGLNISHPTNELDDVIEGVTLTINEITTDPVRISIAEDVSAVEEAFDSFVNGYNELINGINELTAYDPETNVGGALQSDFAVRSLLGQVGNIIRNPVDGLSDEFSSLHELGLKTNSDGTLNLDKEKFQEALDDNPTKVAALFSAIGQPDNNSVEYVLSSSDTEVGNYNVFIESLATAAHLETATALPDFSGGATLTIDGTNDNFEITVDGAESGPLSITQGVYTSGADLAAELQSRINGAEGLKEFGRTVTVSYNQANNRFDIDSNTVGSGSTIAISSIDTGSATLGLELNTGTPGEDVVGTINGVNATGNGNILVGADNTNMEGLNLLINGSVVGDRGSVNFTRGIANQLDIFLEKVLAAESSLDQRIDNLEDGLKALEERSLELELRWEKVEARYLRQFNALDSLLSGLQTTSSFLETQLASLPGPARQDN